MKWLLGRLRPRDTDSNKQYASEILAILVQQSGGLKEGRAADVCVHSAPAGGGAAAAAALLLLCKNTLVAAMIPSAHAAPADANKRKLAASGGMDAVLQAIAPYRNRCRFSEGTVSWLWKDQCLGFGGLRTAKATARTASARMHACHAVPPAHASLWRVAGVRLAFQQQEGCLGRTQGRQWRHQTCTFPFHLSALHLSNHRKPVDTDTVACLGR